MGLYSNDKFRNFVSCSMPNPDLKKEDKDAVDIQDQNGKSGYYTATLVEASGNDSKDEENKTFTVYARKDVTGNMLKIVATPCPPLCDNSSGK